MDDKRDYVRRWSRARNYAMSNLKAARPEDWEAARSQTGCDRDARRLFRSQFEDLYLEYLDMGKRAHDVRRKRPRRDY